MPKSIRSIAGIVAIGCLLPALLQAADSLEDAFREISEQLIAQLPERQKPLVIAIAPIQHNVDRCSEFSFDALEEFSVHFIGGNKFELVERYRLLSILEEHKISNFNIFNPKDQKRLGQLATINAIVIASLSERGQMFRLVVGITDIEKGKTLAKATTKFPATIDVKTLMKRKKDCTYVPPFKPTQPPPDNGPYPPPTQHHGYQGGSDANWKFDRSMNVLEWIYTQDGSALSKSVKYSLDVKKITLAANKILVEAHFHSDKIHLDHCQVACTLEDDIGSKYETLYTQMGRIYTRRLNEIVSINCPAPSERAESITIHLANYYYSDCGSKKWATLPAFNMKLLPVGEFTE
jgi:hypothetical protein